MDPVKAFQLEREERIKSFGNNKALKEAAHQFNIVSNQENIPIIFPGWVGLSFNTHRI